MFGRIFRGPQSVAKPLAEVRDVTVGRAVALDPLAWRRLGDEAAFTFDRDALEITAQGVIALDGGQHVHRFYTDDHVMLQAMSDDAEGQNSYDFSLFVPWSSAYPTTEREGRAWRDRLSAPVFLGRDQRLPDYPRFWFADSDTTQPPVTLWESIWHDRTSRDPHMRIYQTCMLYARDLSAGREMLLALEQQPEGGETTHEIMIGIPLELAEFRV